MLLRKPYSYLLIVVLMFCALLSSAQPNPCGVKAIMSPNVTDSVMAAPGPVYFQNASINATSYKFIMEPYSWILNTPVNWGIQPGLTIVKLVAYNGDCTDTAVAYYFCAGNFPSSTDNPRMLFGYGARDNNIIDLSTYSNGYALAGTRAFWFQRQEADQGFLIKTRSGGCVDWGRKLVDTFPFGTEIKNIDVGPSDATFFLGRVRNTDYAVKLDVQGNVLWANRLRDAGGNNMVFQLLQSAPDGGAVVSGAASSDPNPCIIRFNQDGSVRWARKYGYPGPGQAMLRNICLKDNYVYISSTIGFSNEAVITKLDDATGVTVWARRYVTPNGWLGLNNIHSRDSILVVGFATATGLSNTPTIGGFMRMDTSGAPIAATLVGETYVPNNLVGPYGGNSALVKSGNNFYIISVGSVSLSLQPGISYYTKLIKIDSDYNVSWVQASGGAGVPRFFYATPAPGDGLAIGGNEIGAAMSPNHLGAFLSLKEINAAGGNPNANCMFGNQVTVIVQPVIQLQNYTWTSDAPHSVTAINSNIPIAPYYPEMRFKCPEYVDSCSYLKIEGPRSVCNFNANYTYKSRKNKACGQPTVWKAPPSVQVINQTDSSVTVQFKTIGRHVIYGTNPLSCVPVQDSIIVDANTDEPPPNLGPDREMCPQNTVLLRAGNRYFSYEWSDGSTDSVLTVNQPGKYWVKVTDSCTNVFTDTVEVRLAAPIAISIGADRQICPKDTITLQATGGFMNYQWSPAYNISSQTTQSVLVSPLINTTYTLVAEKTPGCFAYDTVNIQVFSAPSINLGPDTQFCFGDSAVFNAGTGFASYTWNNGSSNAQLTAYTAGEFSVLGVTNDGCRARDTVKVLQVFALPAPTLDQDAVLCVGETKNLDAGAGYLSYQWSTGSTSQTITVSATGTYRVEVTDGNGCKSNAQTMITKIQPLPSSFLGRDTAICSYGNLILRSSGNYSNYNWNTGSTQSSITITTPGQYWLEVKDTDGCVGRDTVSVAPKQCLKGLHVPSAFTPNGDRRNELFKPLLFGNIKAYKFTVFNRWGTIVFQSTTPGQGWDGRIRGVMQDNGAFVWVCSYQLEGEPAQIEKGTVMLIR